MENGVDEVIDPGENFLTYDGSALLYMLVNAVKEQQEMINQQNEAIKALQLKLEQMEQGK